jgi:hypothetical protein
MRRRIWAHLPAVALWVGFIIWFVSRRTQWPNRVPLQVDWFGNVTSWGSPWFAFGLVVGLGLFFIGLSVLLDELWARQETRRRFNFLSLLDEFVLSFLVAIQGSSLLASARGIDSYGIDWPMTGLIVCGTVLLGVLSEMKRPFRISVLEEQAGQRTAEAFRKHLRARLAAGEKVVFWDIQNPKYVAWLSIGVPLVLWISAGLLIQENLWAASLNAAIGVFLLLFYGGQRTRVSSEGITLRYGLMGIRIFRCRFDEIASIRIRSFAALADFGGYGIRMGRGVTAYFLAGGTGVQLDLPSRRSVMIGSSNSARLAAAIEALSGIPLTIENEETS